MRVGEVHPLHVTEVARVLHGDPEVERVGRGQPVEVDRHPLVDVEHPGGESRRGLGAEQVAVVLQRRAAPGRVDDDRHVRLEALDHPLGERAGVVGEPGVRVQRAAARCERAGRDHVEPGGLQHPLTGQVHVTLPRIHHAPGEHVHPVRRCLRFRFVTQKLEPGPPILARTWMVDRSGLAEGDLRGEAEALRDEVEALRDAERDRARPQQTRMIERGEREPLPARRSRPASTSASRVRFHQPAERHARRARRLAAPALHARVERVDELVVSGASSSWTSRISRDPTARRQRLVARHPERRAGRQAQPALHAGGEFVGVDPEIHQRPSARRAVATGVEAAGRVEVGLHPPMQIATHRASTAARRLRVARRSTSPTPTSATNAPIGRSPSVRAGRPAAATTGAAAAAAVRRTSSNRAGGRASPARRRRRRRGPRAAPRWWCRPTARRSVGSSASRSGERIGVRRQPAARRRAGPGVRSDDLAEQAERAERADQQPAQVEAGHVLDRGPAAVDDAAVGGHVADLEQRRRATGHGPGAAELVLADGERAADRRRRVRRSGVRWPRVGQRVRAARRRWCRPGPARSSRPARTATHAARGVDHARARAASAPPHVPAGAHRRRTATGPVGARPRRRSVEHGSCVDQVADASSRVIAHDPGRARCARLRCRRSCDRSGSTLPGLARPSGSNASRSRSWASRSSSVNCQRHERPASRAPMPCSPDSTPPASSDARDDLLAGGVDPFEHARLAGVEHEQRVQVAVAGVEHVHHDQLVALGDLVDCVEHLEQLGARARRCRAGSSWA